jgi:hypothetical protein
VGLLNHYFSLQVEVIFVARERWTNTSAMPSWRSGAPTDQPDHTCRAHCRFNDHGLVTLKGKEDKVHLYEPAWELS